VSGSRQRDEGENIAKRHHRRIVLTLIPTSWATSSVVMNSDGSVCFSSVQFRIFATESRISSRIGFVFSSVGVVGCSMTNGLSRSSVRRYGRNSSRLRLLSSDSCAHSRARCCRANSFICGFGRVRSVPSVTPDERNHQEPIRRTAQRNFFTQDACGLAAIIAIKV